MARTINQATYDLHRTKILESAQRLVYTRGYDQVSIADILADLHISKGAFYHYFDSKQALLEGLVEQMAQQVLQILEPIVRDERLSAEEKLRLTFDTASRWKTDRKQVLVSMAKVWYADENAILRQKARDALLPVIARMITEIIHQGLREGIWNTPYPDQVSPIMFSLLQDFGDTLVALIVKPGSDPEILPRLEILSASHQDAMERILGAASGSLPLFDTTILREWFTFSTNHS